MPSDKLWPVDVYRAMASRRDFRSIGSDVSAVVLKLHADRLKPEGPTTAYPVLIVADQVEFFVYPDYDFRHVIVIEARHVVSGEQRSAMMRLEYLEDTERLFAPVERRALVDEYVAELKQRLVVAVNQISV